MKKICPFIFYLLLSFIISLFYIPYKCTFMFSFRNSFFLCVSPFYLYYLYLCVHVCRCSSISSLQSSVWGESLCKHSVCEVRACKTEKFVNTVKLISKTVTIPPKKYCLSIFLLLSFLRYFFGLPFTVFPISSFHTHTWARAQGLAGLLAVVNVSALASEASQSCVNKRSVKATNTVRIPAPAASCLLADLYEYYFRKLYELRWNKMIMCIL
jgi:hypothetical protein